MTQEHHAFGDASIRWGRSTSLPRSADRTATPGLLEPLLKLKHESWHKRTPHPFRAGLATTSWQLAQAHSLTGKRFVPQHDDTLVVMALTGKPGANIGWALAALTLQRDPRTPEDASHHAGFVTVTDVSFSAAAPQEHRELFSALLDTARQAAVEAWQVVDIKLGDAVQEQHVRWLDHCQSFVAG